MSSIARSPILTGGLAATVVLVAVAGCATAAPAGSGGPAPSATAAPAAPARPVATGADAQAQLAGLPMPSAAEPVMAIGLALDDGDPILCLGPVMESAPPQCSGPALAGFDWAQLEPVEMEGVRWAQVAMQVTYDAASHTVTQAGELLDLAAITMPAIEYPTGDLDEATIAAVQADLDTLERADVLGHVGMDGLVVLTVTFDDGSMQAALDEVYGNGVVFVESALR
ncbi:hypothetical protein L332_02505 [Agrococcus pavilionensis RW1]|uniref:Uncharacterized protein n=1 Tax=Agrococcus pavilionensis RW1 TaxID=1330458 RepID=U1LN10_9MICO|nr:hypothetical protein [Agrococcus pavilionensis]ERG63322.1 hypothetical protein L332_02505 [Agrococcus pavilionensis RW1]